MNEYNDALSSLETSGVQVEYSEYSEQHFGSWFIDAVSNPTYRLCFDGRDKNISIQLQKEYGWDTLVYSSLESHEEIIERFIREVNAL